MRVKSKSEPAFQCTFRLTCATVFHCFYGDSGYCSRSLRYAFYLTSISLISFEMIVKFLNSYVV